MTIVFKVSDNVKEKMIKYYQDMKVDKTPPYSLFQVKDFDCVTTMYESGKVMFQGIGADIEASIWVAMEKKLNNRIIDTQGKDKKEDKKDEPKIIIKGSIIGSDEVGTGDYFGPIVVCASFVSIDKQNVLNDLGVKDSKKITDDQIIKIAPKLIKLIPHKILVLDNKSYNANYGVNMNMNKIKAVLHNKALLSLAKETSNYDQIIVDQFTTPKSYYNYLTEASEVVKNINFMTKAEDKVLAVACASIIARYYFLASIKKLNEQYNINIPLGAGTIVDEYGVQLVKKHGDNILREIAKYSFKNTEKINNALK